MHLPLLIDLVEWRRIYIFKPVLESKFQIQAENKRTIYHDQASGLDIKVARLVLEVSNCVLKMFERHILSCSVL